MNMDGQYNSMDNWGLPPSNYTNPYNQPSVQQMPTSEHQQIIALLNEIIKKLNDLEFKVNHLK